MENYKGAISSLLKELGISANLCGYIYIRRAIELVIDNNGIMQQITKTLYPAIAKEYGSTPSRVERAIRHAVEVCFNRGDTKLMNNIFSNCYSSEKGKPTNGEFIATVADYIIINYRGE